MIKEKKLEIISIAIMLFLFFFVGIAQSWSLSLSILNMCIISAVMSMGINMQWGYAGIFNVGIMGFTALGGLAAVLVSYSPVGEAWRVGGLGMAISLFLLISLTIIIYYINKLVPKKPHKYWFIALVIIIGIIVINLFYKPAVSAIEGVNPATTGFFGRYGLAYNFFMDCGWLIRCGCSFCYWKNNFRIEI